MKDWFYEKFVRKNPRVQKAYEIYVQGHLEEHRKSRLKHWLVLLALSWKYRRSQIKRLHTLTLVRQKGSSAKLRMEWIPGACCYNLYVSQDGLQYKFCKKNRKSVCTVENLKQDKMYFFKFKVSMDGKRYSDFSEVLTVSTVKNQELFFMKKLAQNESPGMTSGASCAQDTERKKREGKRLLYGRILEEGRAEISWEPVSKALHYNLYRSEEGGKYKFLIQTEESSYTDKKIESGTAYTYLLKYTLNGKKYQEFPHILKLTAPGEKFLKKNSGRLYEKCA